MPFLVTYYRTDGVRYIHIKDMRHYQHWSHHTEFRPEKGTYLFTRDQANDILRENGWTNFPIIKAEFISPEVEELLPTRRKIGHI